MMTTAAPRRSRVLEIALVLSIAIHLLGLLFYLVWLRHFLADVSRVNQRQEEIVATSDVIRLEKKTVPRPEVKQPVVPPVSQVQPHKVVVQKPDVRPTPVVRREIARIVTKAPALPAYAKPQPIVPTQPNASHLTQHTVPHDQITEADQAEYAKAFARSIAAAKNDLQNIPAVSQAPSAIRRRNVELQGVSFRDLQHQDGFVEHIIQEGRIGNNNWHIIRVKITYSDGFTELVDIPWPFVYPRDNDLIARNLPRIPVQPPPPGFVLPTPFAPSRFVCSFYPRECQALYDSEHAPGGMAAGN